MIYYFLYFCMKRFLPLDGFRSLQDSLTALGFGVLFFHSFGLGLCCILTDYLPVVIIYKKRNHSRRSGTIYSLHLI